MKFGEVLYKLRKQLRLTQAELAAKSDLSHSAIQKAEASDVPKMQDRNYRALAEALEMTPEALDALWQGRDVLVAIPADAHEKLKKRLNADGVSLAEWFIRHAELPIGVSKKRLPKTERPSAEASQES